jgi:hypothetical protein
VKIFVIFCLEVKQENRKQKLNLLKRSKAEKYVLFCSLSLKRKIGSAKIAKITTTVILLALEQISQCCPSMVLGLGV